MAALVASSNPQLVNTRVIPQQLELVLSFKCQPISFLLVMVQSQKKSVNLIGALVIPLHCLLFLTRTL